VLPPCGEQRRSFGVLNAYFLTFIEPGYYTTSVIFVKQKMRRPAKCSAGPALRPSGISSGSGTVRQLTDCAGTG